MHSLKTRKRKKRESSNAADVHPLFHWQFVTLKCSAVYVETHIGRTELWPPLFSSNISLWASVKNKITHMLGCWCACIFRQTWCRSCDVYFHILLSWDFSLTSSFIAKDKKTRETHQGGKVFTYSCFSELNFRASKKIELSYQHCWNWRTPGDSLVPNGKARFE